MYKSLLDLYVTELKSFFCKNKTFFYIESYFLHGKNNIHDNLYFILYILSLLFLFSIKYNPYYLLNTYTIILIIGLFFIIIALSFEYINFILDIKFINLISCALNRVVGISTLYLVGGIIIFICYDGTLYFKDTLIVSQKLMLSILILFSIINIFIADKLMFFNKFVKFTVIGIFLAFFGLILNIIGLFLLNTVLFLGLFLDFFSINIELSQIYPNSKLNMDQNPPQPGPGPAIPGPNGPGGYNPGGQGPNNPGGQGPNNPGGQGPHNPGGQHLYPYHRLRHLLYNGTIDSALDKLEQKVLGVEAGNLDRNLNLFRDTRRGTDFSRNEKYVICYAKNDIGRPWGRPIGKVCMTKDPHIPRNELTRSARYTTQIGDLLDKDINRENPKWRSVTCTYNHLDNTIVAVKELKKALIAARNNP